MQTARIKLAGAEIDKLNEVINSIVEIAKKTNTKLKGPIPLPTKKLKVTTRKTPCGDGKASFDRLEMRVHKRLIDLGIDERALKLIMRVHLPKGVNIEINLLES